MLRKKAVTFTAMGLMLMGTALGVAAEKPRGDGGRSAEKVAEASYVVYQQAGESGPVTFARNGQSDVIDFSGADAGVVLQSAINALPAGGKVFVKAGVYLLRKQGTFPATYGLELPSRIALVGENREATVLRQDADQNVNILIQSKGKGAYDDVLISDLTIDGNWEQQNYQGYRNAHAGTGIDTFGDRWVIERITIRNTGHYGGLWFHCSDGMASDILIDTTYCHDAQYRKWAAGLGFTNSPGTKQNNKVTNVIIKNTAGVGLYFEDQALYNTVSNVGIYGAKDIGIAFEYGAQGNRVIGGVVQDSGKQGVEFWGNPPTHPCSRNEIIGLLISNSGKEAVTVSRSEFTHIQNNVIYHSGRGGGKDIVDIPLFISSYTKIEGNTLVSSGDITYFVTEDTGCDWTSLQHNTMVGTVKTNKALLRGANSRAQGNVGYVTESSGAATMAVNASSVEVAHGLDLPPNINRLHVTPRDDLAGRSYWVGDAGAETFRIHISSLDAGNEHNFGWSYY